MSFTIEKFVAPAPDAARMVREYKPSHPGEPQLVEAVKGVLQEFCRSVETFNGHVLIEANGFVSSDGNAEVHIHCETMRRWINSIANNREKIIAKLESENAGLRESLEWALDWVDTSSCDAIEYEGLTKARTLLGEKP